jgi:hypothetical protein
VSETEWKWYKWRACWRSGERDSARQETQIIHIY